MSKKILLATRPLTPPWDEASKNFAYFLAKSVKDPELQIHILTVKPSSPARGEDQGGVGGKLEGLSDNIIQHPIFPAYDATRAGHSFSQKAILSSYLFTQSHKYDIVHYLFTPTAFNAALIKSGNYFQNVISNVIPDLIRDPKEKKEILRQAQDDNATKRFKTIQTIATLREDLYGPEDWKKMLFADRIVTYSDYSKRKLEAAGFAGVERIYPGIDLDFYSPQPKNAEALKHFDLSPEDFVVMYPGEYVRLGATDMLVEMLVKHLKPNNACRPELDSGPRTTQATPLSDGILNQVQDDNVKFIFACRVKNDADQKKKEEVIAKLTQAGIIDHVRFSDTFKDMPKLYNLTDVVLFPVGNMRGKFDIPLVIIEGYACAKPVIVSDLPIFAEFSNLDISVTVPKGDGDALWSAIEDLRQNEAKRKALGINARAFVEQHFDLRNTALEYERLYRSI